MQFIGYSALVWLAIMGAVIVYVFPGLGLVFGYYLAAAVYLGFVIASPVIVVCLFAILFLWLRKRWRTSCS